MVSLMISCAKEVLLVAEVEKLMALSVLQPVPLRPVEWL